jgi:hypothetical protein
MNEPLAYVKDWNKEGKEWQEIIHQFYRSIVCAWVDLPENGSRQALLESIRPTSNVSVEDLIAMTNQYLNLLDAQPYQLSLQQQAELLDLIKKHNYTFDGLYPVNRRIFAIKICRKITSVDQTAEMLMRIEYGQIRDVKKLKEDLLNYFVHEKTSSIIVNCLASKHHLTHKKVNIVMHVYLRELKFSCNHFNYEQRKRVRAYYQSGHGITDNQIIDLAKEIRKPISVIAGWITHDILAEQERCEDEKIEGNLLMLFAEQSNNLS